jgi:hypothetical protein
MIRKYGKPFIIMVAIIWLFIVNHCFGSEPQDLFEQGNRHFQSQNYSAAINAYQKIVDLEYESGPLYYNIGNCYYKLGQIGKAILFYEKAKRLMPRDKDLNQNLALANLSVVDKIKKQPQFVLFRIWDGFIHLIPKDILVWFVIGWYLLTVLFLILWIVGKRMRFRFMLIRIVIILSVILFIFGFALIGQIQQRKNRVDAVIVVDKVEVMSAPGESVGMEIFALHEGTKVRVDKFSDQWVKIVLPDLNVGWVKKEVLEVI